VLRVIIFNIFTFFLCGSKKELYLYISNKQKHNEMTTLYIDTKNLIFEYVATHRGGLNGAEVKRESASIAKSVKAYGLENEVEHLKNVYKAKEVIFCELI